LRIRFVYQAQLDYEEDYTKRHLVTVESKCDGGKGIWTPWRSGVVWATGRRRRMDGVEYLGTWVLLVLDGYREG
jgi:hypothetical protein